ncbi:MAG: hypothetical protein LBC33_00860 [Mycoplasmataceae bacterium]|nr:hypothetical protein [Mycoplasmataceae bacterium]
MRDIVFIRRQFWKLCWQWGINTLPDIVEKIEIVKTIRVTAAIMSEAIEVIGIFIEMLLTI